MSMQEFFHSLTRYKKRLTIIASTVVVMALVMGSMKLTQVSVSALENPYIGLIEYDFDPYLYKEAKTSSEKLLSLQFGQPLLVVGKTSNNMLEVEVYNGQTRYTGYVESKITKAQDKNYKFDEEFEKKISSFPDSYKQQLRYLHFIYPTWNIAEYKVNRDFASTAATYQKSALVQVTSSLNKGLNADTQVLEGSNWYRASSATTQYYLDPRNYLFANHALVFQKLTHVSAETADDAKTILGSSLSKYATTLYDASKTYDISMFNVVTRFIQEVGSNGEGVGLTGGYATDDTSGIKYYNPFNIGANKGAQDGIDYARNAGWDTIEKGINGGVEYLAKKYVAQGQNSQYLQRFDLNLSNIGTHVYMTNIQAPYTESAKLITGYCKAGLDERSNMTLYVPVFNNMPNYTAYPTTNSGMNISIGAPAGSYSDISNASFNYSNKVAYTGSAVEPKVTITNGNTVLRENVDYALVYSNNTKTGTATVTVYGMNGYVGTKTLNFEITTDTSNDNDSSNTTPTAPNEEEENDETYKTSTSLPSGISESQVKTVVVSGKEADDTNEIQNALYLANNKDYLGGKKYLRVVFKEGETYTINQILNVESNTIITATNATIVRDTTKNSHTTQLFHNIYVDDQYQGKEKANISAIKEQLKTKVGKYDVSENIYVQGGTWDGGLTQSIYDQIQNNTSNLSSSTNVYFAHAKNVLIKDATFKNNYGGHLVEINSSKDVVIDNCDFSSVVTQNQTDNTGVYSIALQIDLAANTSTNHENLSPYYYDDDTVCDSVTVKNSSFNKTRGFNYADWGIGNGGNLIDMGIYHKNITIENNTIANCSSMGLRFFGNDQLTYKNNTITSSAIGMYASRNKNVTMSGNNVNTTQYAIESRENAGANIYKDNTLVAEYGIYSHVGDQVSEISSNNIRGNTQGIYTYDRAVISRIKNNTIHDSKDNGILNKGNSVITSITGNNIYNAKNGAYVANEVTDFSNNTIHDTTGSGIHYAEKSRNTTTNGNKIYNTQYGLWLTGVSLVENMNSNNIYSVSTHGMNVNGGSNVTNINNNTITSGSENNILVHNASKVTNILNNDLSNAKNGIYVGKKCSVGNVAGNTMHDQRGSGIHYAEGSTGGNCNSNKVYNTNRGIWVSGKSTLSNINSNNISNLGDSGIHIAGGNYVSNASYNVIDGAKNAYYVSSSTLVNANKNTMTNNRGSIAHFASKSTIYHFSNNTASSSNKGIWLSGKTKLIDSNTSVFTDSKTALWLSGGSTLSKFKNNKVNYRTKLWYTKEKSTISNKSGTKWYKIR